MNVLNVIKNFDDNGIRMFDNTLFEYSWNKCKWLQRRIQRILIEMNKNNWEIYGDFEFYFIIFSFRVLLFGDLLIHLYVLYNFVFKFLYKNENQLINLHILFFRYASYINVQVETSDWQSKITNHGYKHYYFLCL